MHVPDSRCLYTAPCGNRTKWPSGRCIPLYFFLYILPDGTIGEVVTGDGSCLVLKKTIFDIISRFILSLDVGYYRSLKKEILDLGIRSIFSTSIHRPLFYLVKIQYLTLLSRLCLIWIMNIEHMVAVDSSEYGHLIFKYYFFLIFLVWHWPLPVILKTLN